MTKPKTTKSKKSPAPAVKSKAPKKSKAVKAEVPLAQADAPAIVPSAQPPHRKNKIDLLADMLKRPEGATVDDMTGATGWQKHTVRAAMSYGLTKNRGYQIVSDKPQGGKRIYKIADPA